MIHIGDLVVAVCDMTGCAIKHTITRGQVYTVRGRDYDSHVGRWGLLFEEVHNPVFPYGDGIKEGSYPEANFRKVQKTSIDVFRKMAAPKDMVSA